MAVSAASIVVVVTALDHMASPPSPGRRAYLTACLCFKNAASYLAEWLAFHRVLGVEHFYLYDNDSTDDSHACLAPYLASGRATLIRFPGQAIQRAVYQHCLDTHGTGSRWMMFCDDDEFLFPVRDVSLPDALVPYERYAGVGVAWMMYGSSGHLTRPPGLVFEAFTRRAAAPDRHVKCIVDPARTVGPVVIAHQFRCRGGLMVDEKCHPLRGPFALQPTADTLRINHYVTKSRAELIERRSRIQANTGRLSPHSIPEWLELDLGWNAVEDRIALRYAERVRAAIGSNAPRSLSVPGALVPAA